MSESSSKRTKSWVIAKSKVAENTFNPIRAVVDTIDKTGNPEKPMIPLSIGDPTVFGNLPVAPTVTAAVKESIDSGKYNGYPPSIGYLSAREAIAKYASEENAPLTAEDVVIASGCSGALDLCISALANEGENILVPAPGFSLYKTLCGSKGIETRAYKLDPAHDWEADLAHVESLIDDKTALILVTNPSNPCGSVFRKEHIQQIIAVAEKHHLPIVADEIYAHMTFKGNEFHSVASLSKNVPVLSCGGLAKRFLVPGWRVGWILIHNRNGAFDQTKDALVSLSQLILGANSLIQGALPDILLKTPADFFTSVMDKIEASVSVCYDALSKIPGLKPVKPKGAMYLMVGIDMAQFKDFSNDKQFCQALLTEESVFCLPAEMFECPNFFRIVTTVPMDKMVVAMTRISEFCERHHI